MGEPETRIGRYLVIERIGEGGMGTVLAAYDPELDRRVAIKVLRAGAGDPRTRARLVREARAMARLSDPHVVAVYEAGVQGDDVFVAMELVQGSTLRAWLRAAPRRWREVVAVFREAAQGLAAAHAVDLVHRDFKPDNVLIGDDPRGAKPYGRVRVADFGLARAPVAWPSERDVETPAPFDTPVHVVEDVTRTGAAPGTPAYMAPEQFLGDPIDARTDQFAFCVALWEALYGVRPFGGRTRLEIADAVVNGRIDPPPSDADVPMWLRAVVERGLAVSPDDRHPSMSALSSALDRDPNARRRRATLAFGALALLGLGAWAGAGARTEASRAPCSEAEAHLAGAWDEPRRQAVRTAFAESGVADPTARADAAIAGLDRFAARWVEEHRDACEAASVRREQSMEVLDRRTRCLWRRRQSLAALTDLLARADAIAVEHAVEAVADLPAPESCGDLEFVAAEVEPPADPATAERTEAVRETIARIDAEARAGHVREARRAAEALLEDVATLEYAPARAEAALACGNVRDAAGAWVDAEKALRSAYFEAIGSGADDTAAEAAGRLAYVVGYEMRRDDDGTAWAEHARALAGRPGVDPSRSVRIALDAGAIHLAFGRHEEAERELRAAVDELRAGGHGGLRLAGALNGLGGVALLRGRLDVAEHSLDEALELYGTEIGGDHPAIATVLDNLGAVAWHRLDYERATELQARALQMREATLGPDHPDVISSLINLAGTAVAQSDFERAHELLERALAIHERRDDAPALKADALHNLAVVRRALHRDDAEAPARAALEAREAALGPDHLEVARSHANVGWILDERGDRSASGPHFARALSIREAAEAPPGDVADARFGLARAEWADLDRRAIALETARRALAEARRGGEPDEALADRIAAWLDATPKDRSRPLGLPL